MLVCVLINSVDLVLDILPEPETLERAYVNVGLECCGIGDFQQLNRARDGCGEQSLLNFDEGGLAGLVGIKPQLQVFRVVWYDICPTEESPGSKRHTIAAYCTRLRQKNEHQCNQQHLLETNYYIPLRFYMRNQS